MHPDHAHCSRDGKGGPTGLHDGGTGLYINAMDLETLRNSIDRPYGYRRAEEHPERLESIIKEYA